MTREEWRAASLLRVGKSVRQARRRAGISQDELAERIGSSRNAIQNIESPRGRKSAINVFDLLEIAAALGVPPVQLLYPQLPADEVEYLPGVTMPAIDAAQTFSGERSLTGPPEQDILVMRWARRWRELSDQIHNLEVELELSPLPTDAHSAALGTRSAPARLEQARSDLAKIETALADLVDGGERG